MLYVVQFPRTLMGCFSSLLRARSIPGLKPILPSPTYDSKWWDLGFKAVILSLRAPLDGEV